MKPPMVPPSAWFTDPKLPVLAPLAVTADGQVFGHVAGWETSPPRSPSGYAHFHVGEVLCADGARVPVGRLSLGAAGVEHYDHTGTCVADVVAGEDDHGIWIAGALRPDISNAQTRRLLTSAPFCEWRRLYPSGAVELVGLLSVPGFDGSGVMLADLDLVASAAFRLPFQPTLVAARPEPVAPAATLVADFIAGSIGRPTSATRTAAAAIAARVDALVGSTRAERDHDRLVASLAGSGWAKARDAEQIAALHQFVHGIEGRTTP